MSILGRLWTGASWTLDEAYWRRYDLSHRRQALDALRIIERFNGVKLSARDRKAADAYAADVFGSRRYAPWLYVYTLVNGQFQEGWIPDNFFGRWVYPSVNTALRVVTDYKSLSKVLLRTDALPDVGYRINGGFYDQALCPVEFDALRRQLCRSWEYLFIKSDVSSRGRGVKKVAAKDLDARHFESMGNCVIQSAITQHPFLDSIVPGSVATIRVTTVKDKQGEIGVRGSYLRLGRLDTAWVKSDNSVRVAIVDEDGGLDAFGYTQDWRQWKCHPDTGFVFAGKSIPKFREAAATCLCLHARVPHFAIIGWDVTVDLDSVVRLIEWNGGHCDIKFSEATTGPWFADMEWEKLGG